MRAVWHSYLISGRDTSRVAIGQALNTLRYMLQGPGLNVSGGLVNMTWLTLKKAVGASMGMSLS